MIFHDLFYCRYKNFIYYSSLSFILPSVFRLSLHLQREFLGKMFVFHNVKPLVSALGYNYLGHIRQVKFWNQIRNIFQWTLYHIETGQLICKAISWLVSIWYEFLLKFISKQTIVQYRFFSKICLFLKNKVILVPWKYFNVWHYLYVK